SETKAILLPSGDQTGFKPFPRQLTQAVSLVSGVRPESSAFITQMFWAPLALTASLPSRARFDTKAILLPSSDQTGLKLSAPTMLKPVPAMAVSLVSGAGLEPSAFMTQTF